MSQAITVKPEAPTGAAALERVLIKGDLSGLTEEQRLMYYHAVCESVGLNYLTQPFEYLILNGKLRLYALKGCTDQLRANHKISIERLEAKTEAGVYLVTAHAVNAEGRSDSDIGAVSIANLKGTELANAIMKATTKAKRRVTLSICGLGMLDESEVEDIPHKQREAVKDYISAAPPANALPPAPPPVADSSSTPDTRSPRRAKPYSRNERNDNVQAIGELIKELQALGIGLDTIQAEMKRLTGCNKRAELNGGQAIVVIEAFEEWISTLTDNALAAEEQWAKKGDKVESEEGEGPTEEEVDTARYEG